MDAAVHWLVAPKDHIRDCESPGALSCVHYMVQVAEQLVPGAHLSLHGRGYTSQDHLHLHVLVPPWRNQKLRRRQEPAKDRPWIIDARVYLREACDPRHPRVWDAFKMEQERAIDQSEGPCGDPRLQGEAREEHGDAKCPLGEAGTASPLVMS